MHTGPEFEAPRGDRRAATMQKENLEVLERLRRGRRWFSRRKRSKFNSAGDLE